LLVVNTTNVVFKVKLIPRDEFGKPGSESEPGEYSPQTGTPYGLFRRPLISPDSHLPCIAPPWGTVAAVDMGNGEIQWQVPLGTFTLDHPSGSPGSLSFGGPIVTAGGLVFTAGTLDPFLRAFDLATGKELWKGQLPAPGHATPMTYQLSPGGKQYVVIAAGGHAKITEEPQSDAVVAFTLP
jgi:quinoprotein glucose dehydrogenase